MYTKNFLFDASVLIKEEVFSLLYSHISPDRKKKIDKFKVDKPKYTSLGAEILLHYALKQFNVDLNQHSIIISPYGKPELTNSCLHFNISHSYPYVLVSVSDQPVGCDIEQIKDHNHSIADKFFHRNEIQVLHNSHEQEKDFTKLWTLKEAYSKYTGEGLNRPLNDTDFSMYIYNNKFRSNDLNYYSNPINDFILSVCSETEIDEGIIVVSLNEIIMSYQN